MKTIRKKTRKNSNFLALIVRCKNEPYVAEFVDYYIRQGVDKIFILDDHSDKNTYKHVNKRVKIIVSGIDKQSEEFDHAKQLYQTIRHQYEWIIIVDMDEYITTKKNITKTIRDELKTTFKDCMCVQIPWVMMSCNSIRYNPESLLKTNVYRWNHDKKHPNPTNEPKFRCRYDEIEVKYIVKPKYFETIDLHQPLHPIGNVKIVDGVRNKPRPNGVFYKNLREKDIQEGYLLCYHYRIVSVEQCLNKIKYNLWYKKYNLKQLLSFDHPEILDETLKHK